MMFDTDIQSCFAAGMYPNSALIVNEVVTIDESGQRAREWNFAGAQSKSGRAEPILGGGIRVVGSTRDFSGGDLEDTEYTKFFVTDLKLPSGGITKEHRITGIKGNNGQPMFVDGEGKETVFNILGINPVPDPFGNVVEYELLLRGVTGD